MHRESAPAPQTLLVHDGELADVRTLLGELGTPFTERRGALCPEDRDTAWDLVIGTPARILRLHLDPSRRPAQIAMVDEDSRTLRNSLRRAGIRVVVRRPVHRAALRAVILHALYRGPEKRRSARVSVGAPVRYRQGWRRRTAILADLSLGGCRLLTPHPVEIGRKVTVQLPADVAGGKSVSARARVLRSTKAPGEPAGTRTVTARFESVGRRLHERLKRAVASHASGPATFEADDDEPVLVPTRAPAGSGAARPPAPAPPVGPVPPNAPAAASPAPAPQAVPRAADAPSAPAAAAAAAPADAERGEPERADTAPDGERRESPRHALEQRVIELGDEASRVLMGRDISIGGMRVDPNPNLRLGEDLRLAIHLGDREAPLVVGARVHRDDRERGMVLRFHELSAEASRYLNRTVDTLPLVDPERGEGMLVTEILESR